MQNSTHMISISFKISYCTYISTYENLKVNLHIGNMCLHYDVDVYRGNTILYKYIKNRCANSK